MGKSAKINSEISKGYKNPFKNKFGNKNSNFKNNFSKKNQFKKSKPNLAEQWGKEKFVPQMSKRPRDNPPVDESATPWGIFKTELLEKKRAENHVNAVNMNSAEAKEILQQREQNYRRTLIQSQAKQPTKWEKFDDDEESKTTNSTDKNYTRGNGNKSKLKVHKNDAKEKNFSGIELKNFDAKKLSVQQNNNMRKALTKGFMSVSDRSLASAVRDMKRKEEKKKEKFKTEKPEINSKNKQKQSKKIT